MAELQLRRPRRSLPWDVLLVLFELADPASLALLGGVSYDFLVATAPHLYRDVVLKSFSEISSLFCQREEKEKSRSSRVNPLLTLDNVQSLTLDLHSAPAPSTFTLIIPQLSFDRISVPIPLDSLIISVPRLVPKKYLGLIQILLLPELNPRRCEYRMVYDLNFDPDSPDRVGRVFPVHKEEGYTLYSWRRIQVVDFIGCIPYTPLNYYGEDDCEVAFLPYSIFPQVKFRYDVLSLRDETSYTPEEFVENLEDGHWWSGYQLMEDGSMVLVVRSLEEKEEVEAAVAQTIGLRKKFSVVLEP